MPQSTKNEKIGARKNAVDTDAFFGDYNVEPALSGAEDEMSELELVHAAVAGDDARDTPKRKKPIPDDIDCLLFRAERQLARLDERFHAAPKRLGRATLLSAVRDAAWTSWLECESRSTSERRVLKWFAFDGLYGDKLAEVELLEDAVDFARAILWRTKRNPSFSDRYLDQLSSKTYQRRQIRQAHEKTKFILNAARKRSLPALFSPDEMAEIRASIGEYTDELDGILGAAHRHAKLLIHALQYVDEENELQVRGAVYREKIVSYNTTSRGALWFKTCIALGPTIIARSCDLPTTPALPIAYAAARNGAIWPLVSEHKQEIDPVRLVEAYSYAIDELVRIDRTMQSAWQSAEDIVATSKGNTMRNIVGLVFDHGHTTIAQIAKTYKITPQAAHYQLNRLIEHGVVERFTSGKEGGHYFLKCLVQATS